MTAPITTVPVPAWKLRAGDVIRPDGPAETVEYVSDIKQGAVIVNTDAATRGMPSHMDVPALAPVGYPTGDVGLYRADGSGISGCTCVYRVVDPRLSHEQVAETPSCPSHGADRFDDDEWD